MLKVSVVVAVFNPGHDIDELLDSIDQQSMPASEFEAIFVDDDSTDGTRERLQEWARDRPNVTVLHNTPNSGWPGRPRNLGIDAARGEYIFFADNDDKLTPNGLELMHRFARENNSDVVIPKEVGVGPGRGVPRALFRRNIPDAKLGHDPILQLLTPHKLVRATLLREHDIRFPEGRVRLEDHFVMVSCFFAAKRISIFADEPCYYWLRQTGSVDNASFHAVDPVTYYQSVERVLEIVERNTEPGAFRTKLYSRWYKHKMLARLRGEFLLQFPDDYQQSLVVEIRRVIDRFGLDDQMIAQFGAALRARVELLMHGSLDDIRLLAAAERGVTQTVELEEASWTDEGQLVLSVRSQFRYADGAPIALVCEGDRVFWDAAQRIPGLRLERVDVTDLVQGNRLDVLLSDRDTHDVRFASGRSKPSSRDRVGATAHVLIDPVEVFKGKPHTTVIDLRVRLLGLGWASEVRLPVGAVDEFPVTGPELTAGRVHAYATNVYGNLSLRLVAEGSDPSISARQMEEPGAVTGSGDVAGWSELGVLFLRKAARKTRRAAGKARQSLRERRGLN